MKMQDADIKISKVYGSPFVWEENELHAHAAQFDLHYIGRYSTKDPRTWPLVRSVKLQNGKDYCKSKTPPPYVAYDALLMTDLVMHKPMHKIIQHQECQGEEGYSRGFQLYPFNFSRQGSLRKTEYIPPDEFNFWIYLWESNSDVLNTSTNGPTSSTMKRSHPVEVDQDASSSPYDQIIEALHGTDAASQDASAKMQAGLRLYRLNSGTPRSNSLKRSQTQYLKLHSRRNLVKEQRLPRKKSKRQRRDSSNKSAP